VQHGSFTGRRIVLLVETDRRFFVVGYSIYRDGQSFDGLNTLFTTVQRGSFTGFCGHRAVPFIEKNKG
jgi:hypothetical protein